MGGWRSSAASPQALCFWGLAALDRQPPSVHFCRQQDFAVLLAPGAQHLRAYMKLGRLPSEETPTYQGDFSS